MAALKRLPGDGGGEHSRVRRKDGQPGNPFSRRPPAGPPKKTPWKPCVAKATYATGVPLRTTSKRGCVGVNAFIQCLVRKEAQETDLQHFHTFSPVLLYLCPSPPPAPQGGSPARPPQRVSHLTDSSPVLGPQSAVRCTVTTSPTGAALTLTYSRPFVH